MTDRRPDGTGDPGAPDGSDGRDDPDATDDPDSPGGRVARLRDYLLDATLLERVLLSALAFVASLVAGAGFVLFAGLVARCSAPALAVGGYGLCYDPFEVYATMFAGAFGSAFNLSLTLSETTVLVLTGASVAVAFNAGLFNIGTQGQLVLGALATALALLAAAPLVPSGVAGSAVLLPLGLLTGTVVGGLYAAIPGALKAYADANEVITTILLNFIATAVAAVLVLRYFKAPDTASVMTRPLPRNALLGTLLFPSGSSFSVYALLIAVLVLVLLYYLLAHTTFGYDIRVAGLQESAAGYARVDLEWVTLGTMVVSGAFAGLAGAVYVMMVLDRWRRGIPPIGFDGIAVSVLAGNNPAGIVPAALLFGTLKSGSLAVDLNLGVPRQLTGVLRGLIILFVATPEFLRQVADHAYGDRLVEALEGEDR